MRLREKKKENETLVEMNVKKNLQLKVLANALQKEKQQKGSPPISHLHFCRYHDLVLLYFEIVV